MAEKNKLEQLTQKNENTFPLITKIEVQKKQRNVTIFI